MISCRAVGPTSHPFWKNINAIGITIASIIFNNSPLISIYKYPFPLIICEYIMMTVYITCPIKVNTISTCIVIFCPAVRLCLAVHNDIILNNLTRSRTSICISSCTVSFVHTWPINKIIRYLRVLPPPSYTVITRICNIVMSY